ncbi:hypothetical protein EOPP23_09945 [Endozoicomonas sp. OPT23]|uniref:hypothetical protein n=1 Tax=Endozoicomonas sp. OPT23 TaxID=2072845 RepID=UPI00129AA164|nr:hypothetical protein [Endozoicomonas sp. OPT23]MRI33304.1 hypothetical protein [Endozoicomonas sp. OPT23]
MALQLPAATGYSGNDCLTSPYVPDEGRQQCVNLIQSSTNTESDYEPLKLDARTYKAFSPKTTLALRIDLTQSNQDDEATLLYFRIGESF